MPAEISQAEADLRVGEIEALWQMLESEVMAPFYPRQTTESAWSAT